MFNLFPQDPAPPSDTAGWRSENGMTLRDYFAAKAMEGLINQQVEVIPTLAQMAYEIADAMLKARDEQ